MTHTSAPASSTTPSTGCSRTSHRVARLLSVLVRSHRGPPILLTPAAQQGYRWRAGGLRVGSRCEAGRFFLAGERPALLFRPAVYNVVHRLAFVNPIVTSMSDEFRKATDRLIESVTLADLARELGVSHGLLRQARLASSASSYRSPPAGWQVALAKLAERRAGELQELAKQFRSRDGA